jgi:hypothetical protein
MPQCAFCTRIAIHGGTWALTAQAVDGSWRREILPLCSRCDRLLREAVVLASHNSSTRNYEPVLNPRTGLLFAVPALFLPEAA